MTANKALGQHWLKNREVLDYIASMAGGAPLAVEIGPGLGTLTSSLLRVFDKVIAVEFDAKLAHNLPASFPGKNLEVVNGDILQFDFNKVPAPYAVAGNIPYYITSPIIERVLTAENRPERVVLLMQKEVAERIASDKETLLSLRCKNLADVELGWVVKAEEFTPPPKVDSQVLILTPHAPVVGEEVMEFAKLAFAKPRKKLINNLAGTYDAKRLAAAFSDLEIDENARPGDLHLDEWQKLYEKVI